jgi:hypothetical protein
MISHKEKFVFIHIPKTAGTSLEIALEDESCTFKRGQWSKKPMGFNAPLNHLTITQIQQSKELSVNDFNSFFKFTFVRNPWDKVISECFCGQIQLVFKNCTTIKEKIKKVCELAKTPCGYANHCKPQKQFVIHENFKIDFIGRFENLQEDYSSVCRQLNIEKKELTHKNKSKKKPYQEYFDQETIDLVAKTYEEDIKYFGYNFNS